jgi:RNA polymerase sigma-70 factor (ECF subfamily)
MQQRALRGEMPFSRPARGVPNFDEVYQQHFAFVFRSLRGLGVPPASLDDAVQEVFLVVHRRLPDFEERSSLRTWLFSIAYHVSRGLRRREQRKGGLADLDPNLPGEDLDPEARTENGRAWQFVSDFLKGLEDGKRAVFVLCVLEQATAAEAAESLQIPINTVYSRIHAARRAFRAALETRAKGELG